MPDFKAHNTETLENFKHLLPEHDDMDIKQAAYNLGLLSLLQLTTDESGKALQPFIENQYYKLTSS